MHASRRFGHRNIDRMSAEMIHSARAAHACVHHRTSLELIEPAAAERSDVEDADGRHEADCAKDRGQRIGVSPASVVNARRSYHVRGGSEAPISRSAAWSS
ncbi:hypothetical protein AJ87_44850 [Rhizobium yanglingense]|nr:hypothetical protein AJ87_44850 [Rhizobium yanglingense]